MDCHVDVKISQVDDDEIRVLNSIISTLPDIPLENRVRRFPLHKEYVVTIEPATLTELKKVLHVVVPVVDFNRIDIET